MTSFGGDRLDSWKGIANYLNTSVRTVQRWEKQERLPVHRHGHARQDTVYAFKLEVDRWRLERDGSSKAAGAPFTSDLESLQAELVGASSRVRTAAWRSHQGPILARYDEIGILHENLAAVRSGAVRMVCLAGEPGTGKTTLLDQFVAGLEGTPGQLATFSACPQRLAGAEAFLPILETLDELTRAGEDVAITKLLRLTAPTWYVQIAPLWSALDEGFASVLEHARAASPERLKRELFTFVKHLTAVIPLVIAMDDLHWADTSTIELLAYLLTRPELSRLLIVCAYRQTEMALSAHPFVSIRYELIRRRICVELPIRLLNYEEVLRYLELVFPGSEFPPKFADAILARTNGNPLFLCELTRELVHRGAVCRQESRWVLNASVDSIRTALPVSVQAVIDRKVEQLDQTDRNLLAVASLQGLEFDSRLAAMAAGLGMTDAEHRLRRLESIHSLIVACIDDDPGAAIPAQRFAFVHLLYQEAFYGLMTPAGRAAAALITADGLAEIHKQNPSRVAAELAILYEMGRNFEPAAQWFLQAARNAAAVHANHEAGDLCRRAISAAARLADAQRSALVVDAAMLRAELHLNVSDFESAVVDFGLAEKTASDAEMVEAQIDAVCGAALALFNIKRTVETRALGTKALELARRSGSRTAIASSKMVLAMERMCIGDFETAQRYSKPALEVLQSESRHPVPLHVIEGVGYGAALHGWRLEYGEAFPPCEWALNRARERGSSFHIVCLLFIRGLGLGNFGRLSDSLADLREATRLSEVNHERYWLPRLPNTVGWLHSEMFDTEEALRLNREGSAIAREMKFPEGDANSQINLAFNHLSLGELNSALEHLSSAGALLAQDEWFRWVYTIRLHAGYAEYWLAKENPKQASASAMASLNLAASTRRRKHMAWARKLLGDVAIMEEHPLEAAEYYQAGLSELQGHPCPTVEWKILCALARTHALVKHADHSQRCRAAARQCLHNLGDSIRDPAHARRFWRSRAVQELGR
jgi:tetratricopeptide (TPR) repeat protein